MKTIGLLAVLALLALSPQAHAGTEMIGDRDYSPRPWQPPPPPNEGRDWAPPPPVAYYPPPPPPYYYPPPYAYGPAYYGPAFYGPGFYGPAIGIGFHIR